MIDREMTNVADVVAHQARERPWALAILDGTGSLHYRTFDALVWATAAHFSNAGIRQGDVVGIALPHSALYVLATYGLARIGAAVVALPLSDPAPLREILARRLGVRWVVATSDHAGPAGVPTIVTTVEHIRRAASGRQTAIRAEGGEAIWSIRRTSGTTGEPKTVGRSHRAALLSYEAMAPYYPSVGHRALTMLDLSTTFGFAVVERTFYGGGTVVLGPTTLNPPEFLKTIDESAVTHLSLTANFLSMLLPSLPEDACRCPGLLDVMVSGMAMPEAQRAQIRRRLSPNLSIVYGSNEASGVTHADRQMQEAFPETVGRALPGIDLQVVDDEDRPVAAGVTGHIRARAPWMPAGYMNMADRNSRSFRDGWIYLGDLGTLSPEGMVFLKGRIDDMMNFDGVKIMPVDIEEALLAHPAVVEAVAFPVESEHHQNLPAAAAIVRQPVTEEDLLAHCRDRLGIRAPVMVSIEASFPRNAGGKVLRTELAARLAGKVPAKFR